MARQRRTAPRAGQPSSPRAARGAPRAAGRRRWLRRLALLVLAAALVRTLLLESFGIPSRSMEDTLLLGDVLLVEKIGYGMRIPLVGTRLQGLRPPQPGDVVVFRYPEDPERAFVKRCVAVPGQTVEVRDKVVYVNGERATDPPYSKYLDARILPASGSHRDNLTAQAVPAGDLFVMGDNRDNSRDSRHWGFLTQDHLIGRALCVLWSTEPPGPGEDLRRQVASLPRRIRWSRLGAVP